MGVIMAAERGRKQKRYYYLPLGTAGVLDRYVCYMSGGILWDAARLSTLQGNVRTWVSQEHSPPRWWEDSAAYTCDISSLSIWLSGYVIHGHTHTAAAAEIVNPRVTASLPVLSALLRGMGAGDTYLADHCSAIISWEGDGIPPLADYRTNCTPEQFLTEVCGV